MPENEKNTEQIRRLLEAANGDACLLWLAEKNGMEALLAMPLARRQAAQSVLEALGLARTKPMLRRENRPVYSEASVVEHFRTDPPFSALVNEVQRMLGRVLSTEELKCLLSVHDYLRLSNDMIFLLVTYCTERSRLNGRRAPSIRTIEKEAYAWCDAGVDTFEAAREYMRRLLQQQSREGSICRILQISSRQLTDAERKYLQQWIAWGFPDETIAMAYEKTCLNTGGLRWPYLHSILARWQEKGLFTPDAVKKGDGGKKTQGGVTPAQGKYKPMDGAVISDLEKKALKKLMGEEV